MREVGEQLVLTGLLGGVALLSALLGLRFVPSARSNGDDRELVVLGLGFAVFCAVLAVLLGTGAVDAVLG